MKTENRKTKIALKRVTTGAAILFAGVSLLYGASYLILPFGNHLANVISFTSTDRRSFNLANRAISSYGLSRAAIYFNGIACDAPVLDLSEILNPRYSSRSENSIGVAIVMYESSRERLGPEQKEIARKLILNLISHCDPNAGTPLFDAVFAREPEFVLALLERGADPLIEHKFESGRRHTSYRVALGIVSEGRRHAANGKGERAALEAAEEVLALIERALESGNDKSSEFADRIKSEAQASTVASESPQKKRQSASGEPQMEEPKSPVTSIAQSLHDRVVALERVVRESGG